MPGLKKQQNSSVKQKKGADFFYIVVTNILVPIIAAPFLLLVSGLIFKKGFSLRVNILFLFWVLWYVVFLVFLFYFPYLKKNKKTIRKSSKIIFIVIFLLLILFSILLLSGCLAETLNGTLFINAAENSKNIPEKIYITRGFPNFLSFLDVKKELKYDLHKKQFSTPDYVRYGNWYLYPEPAKEYSSIPEALNISKDKFKCEQTILFHKRLCRVNFITETEEEKPLNGASIKIDPVPYGFLKDEKTNCSMNIEMGTYTITFNLEGFEEHTISRTLYGDDDIEIKVYLKKKADEVSPDENKKDPGDKKQTTKPPGKIETNNEPDPVVSKDIESMRFIRSMDAVGYYIKTKQISAARDLLIKMKSEYQDKNEYLEKILDLLKSLEDIDKEKK